jgi:DNA-binding CsgD family transcriptional regulator
VVADRLVGRVEELRSLELVLDELDGGHPGVIALVGEPGIGKTRLLRELAAHADARGLLVLSGGASELEHDLPFSVFVDAVDEYVGGLELGPLVIDEQVQGELAHVFPSLWALAGGQEVALQQERYRSHRAVRALLERLAAPMPLVLVLDDVHWADSASIELLGALLRRPPAAAVLIALAMRPRQTPERLSAALERAHREGALTRIELGALSPAEVRAFLGEAVDPAQTAALYQESGGNPFYLEQLARALERTVGAASAAVELGVAIEVPSAVAAALTEELALLSDTARLVLEGAAVVGDPFEPELAAAAAGMSEDSTMDALDELLQLDVIRQMDVPRRFRFRHPLMRRAVYETTRGGWRLGAHERCAKALAARGATPAARAHHVERSAREGDSAAIAVLREAGEAAVRLAPSSSAQWFGAALRLLPGTAPSEERVALLLARAGGLAATGHFAESHADLLSCIELVPRGVEHWRVRVMTACAAVEQLLGLQTEAHRHLTTALAQLGGAESAEAVDLMIELAVAAFHAGDFDAMRGWGGRAVAGATALGERPLLAAALAVRAWAGAVAGDGQQAQTHCDEATELIDELSDEELAERLNALAHLASADLFLDRFPAATLHAQRALGIGRATGQGESFPLIVAMLGGSLWVQGRPLEAGEVFDGAVEAARLAGNVQGLALHLFNRSFAALVAGDVDLALATAEESFDLEESMEPGALSAIASCVLAGVLLETGQADRSVDLLLTRGGGEELGQIGGAWRARFLELLTRALLASGGRADAERAAAAAQACADAVALPSAVAMASLATAALALDAGDPTTAADRALAAAASFESVSALFDAARARELAGRALGLAGVHDRAGVELELAAAGFESFGAFRYRDQAERELRKLGYHIHRRSRSGETGRFGMESLTERELQVVRLVIDRKTNREIGAELFISQKTVETHLRNIFHKMKVSTRVELARAVERADRVVPAGMRAAGDRLLAGNV